MDDTGALRRFHSVAERPGAHFVGARREERTQVEQAVGGFDQSADAALLQTQLLEEHLALFVGLQLGNLALDLGGYDQHLGALFRSDLAHCLHVGVAVHGGGFVHVADVQHGFVGQQEQLVRGLLLLFVLRRHDAGRLALLERSLEAQVDVQRGLGLFVAAHAHLFLDALDTRFNGLQILELQLGVDDLLVAHGVHGTVHMNDVVVVEAAEHMDDSIGLADVGEEFVAESFAAAGAFDESRDVHYLDGGGDDAAFGFAQFAQLDQSLVGHGDDTHVRLDGAEGKVRRLRFGAAQAVKQGRFAHIRQTYYSTL